MKKKLLGVLPLLLFISVSSIQAQQNLMKWIEKCENIPSVDVSSIQTKDAKTRQPKSKVMVVTFQDNEALTAELLTAYAKDKDEAYMVSEKRRDGEVLPDYIRFGDGELETRFLFEFKPNRVVSVTMQIFYDYRDVNRYPNG